MSATAVTYTMTLTPTNDALVINESGAVTAEEVELHFATLIKGDKGDSGTIDTTTNTTISGIIKGANGKAAQAVEGVDYQTAVGLSIVDGCINITYNVN